MFYCDTTRYTHHQFFPSHCLRFAHTADKWSVDTSASMIAASGMIELGAFTGDATYTNAVSMMKLMMLYKILYKLEETAHLLV